MSVNRMSRDEIMASDKFTVDKLMATIETMRYEKKIEND